MSTAACVIFVVTTSSLAKSLFRYMNGKRHPCRRCFHIGARGLVRRMLRCRDEAIHSVCSLSSLAHGPPLWVTFVQLQREASRISCMPCDVRRSAELRMSWRQLRCIRTRYTVPVPHSHSRESSRNPLREKFSQSRRVVRLPKGGLAGVAFQERTQAKQSNLAWSLSDSNTREREREETLATITALRPPPPHLQPLSAQILAL